MFGSSSAKSSPGHTTPSTLQANETAPPPDNVQTTNETDEQDHAPARPDNAAKNMRTAASRSKAPQRKQRKARAQLSPHLAIDDLGEDTTCMTAARGQSARSTHVAGHENPELSGEVHEIKGKPPVQTVAKKGPKKGTTTRHANVKQLSLVQRSRRVVTKEIQHQDPTADESICKQKPTAEPKKRRNNKASSTTRSPSMASRRHPEGFIAEKQRPKEPRGPASAILSVPAPPRHSKKQKAAKPTQPLETIILTGVDTDEPCPSESQICRMLERVVVDCFSRDDLESLTISRVRTAAESTLQLPLGFLKASDVWKSRSKSVITAEVERQQDMRRSIDTQPSATQEDTESLPTAVRNEPKKKTPYTTQAAAGSKPESAQPRNAAATKRPRKPLGEHIANAPEPVRDANKKPRSTRLKQRVISAPSYDENDEDSSFLESNGFLDHFPAPKVPSSLAMVGIGQQSTKLRFRL